MAERGDTPPSGTPTLQGDPSGPTLRGEPEDTSSSNGDVFAHRPELFVGAAFVGGFALAQLLKRMGR